MGGHVIGTFVRMYIIGRILRNHHIHVVFKIYPNRGVGVFIDGETCRGMLSIPCSMFLISGILRSTSWVIK